MIGSLWMQSLWSGFSRLVGDNIARWFMKLVGFVGIAFVSYEAVYEPLMQLMLDKLADLPATMLQWMGALGIDVALTMIWSAIITTMLAKVGIRKRGA